MSLDKSAKRSPGRPGEKLGTNKEEILRLALKKFAKEGYGGMSLNALAKQVNVAPSLLAYHFETKEKLWKGALSLIAAEITKEIEDMFKIINDLDGLEQLRLYCKKIVYISAENPEFQQIVVQEVFSESERSEWLIEELLQPIFGFMGQILEEERSKGTIKNIPDANLVSFILGAITTFFSRSFQIKKLYGVDSFEEEQVEQHAVFISELIFTGLVKK